MLKDIITKSRLKQINNILYLYDTTINKWISVEKRGITYSINHTNASTDRWMRFTEIPSNNNGFLIARDAIINSISISSKNITSGTFEIYRYNSTDGLVLLDSKSLSTNDQSINLDLDIEVDSGNIIKVHFKAISPNKVDYPIVSLEIAWLMP